MGREKLARQTRGERHSEGRAQGMSGLLQSGSRDEEGEMDDSRGDKGSACDSGRNNREQEAREKNGDAKVGIPRRTEDGCVGG